jgi:hypothetical protein
VFWRGRKALDFVLSVASSTSISIEKSGPQNTGVYPFSDGHIEISGTLGDLPGIVQFSSDSPEVEFDVLVEGAPSPEYVHLGAHADSPLSSIFTLQARTDGFTGLPKSRNELGTSNVPDTTIESSSERQLQPPRLSSGKKATGSQPNSPNDKDGQEVD